MNIFFDIDYTILDAEGEKLRPHVKDVFAQLVADGHAIYLWSGVGVRWDVVHEHGLGGLVHGCYEKPMQNHERERVRLGVPFRPDFVVDDSPSVVSAFGGYVIPPFAPWKTADDAEMLRVYEAIKEYTAAEPG